MVKIGTIELKGELTTIPLKDLVEDVPVTDRHVRDLVGSIKAVGQVSPLVIWAEGNRIIDGFHRVRAMKLAGVEEATCLLYNCDEDTFWNLRILNAVTHRAVHFARIIEWVRKAFTGTKWAQMMQAEEAFRVGRRGAAVHLQLTPSERSELTAWVREKSQLWNLSPQKIGRMLRIAQLADPSLVTAVRDEPEPGTLTQAILEQIATKLPRHDLQKAVVQKVKAEKLSLKDTRDLVEKVAKARTESKREKLLQVAYQRPKKGRPPKSAVQDLQQLRANLVSESMGQLIFILPQLKQPHPFDERVPEVFGVLAAYMGKEDTTALEVLQRENQSLKEETQKLLSELERKDTLINSQRGTIDSMQVQINQLTRRD